MDCEKETADAYNNRWVKRDLEAKDKTIQQQAEQYNKERERNLELKAQLRDLHEVEKNLTEQIRLMKIDETGYQNEMTNMAQQYAEKAEQIAELVADNEAKNAKILEARKEIQRLKDAMEHAIKKLMSHHTSRAGISVIAANLKEAAQPQGGTEHDIKNS